MVISYYNSQYAKEGRPDLVIANCTIRVPTPALSVSGAWKIGLVKDSSNGYNLSLFFSAATAVQGTPLVMFANVIAIGGFCPICFAENCCL